MIKQYLDNDSLSIIVKPNSPKNRIIGYDEARKSLKVEIKAPPEEGKANLEVIKFFSKITGKNVRIIAGMTSKRKKLKFD